MIRMLGRKKVAKRIFWALAIIIVPSFVFWGVGDGVRSSRRNIAARVNRENITRQDFQRHLQQLIEQRRRFNEDVTEIEADALEELKQRALDDLVEQRLLFQQARRMGIRVSDDEIIERLRQDPVFHDDEGRFDQARFEEIVNLVPQEEMLRYEDEIRRSLTLQKLHEAVVAGADVEITGDDIAAAREEFGFSEDVGDEVVRQFASYRLKNDAYRQWLEQVREEAKVRVFNLE